MLNSVRNQVVSLKNAGVIHRLVCQLAKLERWVQFPLPALSSVIHTAKLNLI